MGDGGGIWKTRRVKRCPELRAVLARALLPLAVLGNPWRHRSEQTVVCGMPTLPHLLWAKPGPERVHRQLGRLRAPRAKEKIQFYSLRQVAPWSSSILVIPAGFLELRSMVEGTTATKQHQVLTILSYKNWREAISVRPDQSQGGSAVYCQYRDSVFSSGSPLSDCQVLLSGGICSVRSD